MKKLPSIIAAFVLAVNLAQAQQELPRLAVVEFSANDTGDKIKRDAVTVRNLVESRMVATGQYQIVTRSEIDQLLSNQRIAVSSISSTENVKKLQLQNISYIVTGSVDAMGNDYAITVKILDVSTGLFSHSDDAFIGGGSRELYTGVNTLVASFVKGMAAEGGQVAQAGSRGPRGGPGAAGIGIEVSTVLGGTLYFQDEEIAALWDNDSYTIPIERPGTYKIRMVFGNGKEISRNVTITSRGVVKEAFAPPKPPGNLRTGTISRDTVELSWSQAGQGLSYRVYSATSNNPAAATLAGTTMGTGYRVTNIRPLTTYYFWVSSQEGTFESAKGQAVQAQVRGSQPADLAEVFGARGVAAAFNAVHAFLQTCNGGSAQGRRERIAQRIMLGDWIDLPHLTVQGDAGGGAINTDNTDLGRNGKLLRLIVVGIDSFAATNRDAPAHVVFQFQNIPVRRRMNASDTNSGGYKNSEMRAYLTGNFLRGLLAAGVPEGALYAPVRYIANGGPGASAADALTDRLWLPTERELFENGKDSYGDSYSTAYETAANQARLEYYDNNNKRKKHERGGDTMWWWEASPYAGSAAYFCDVGTKGLAYPNFASAVGGCAPAFCVR